METVTKRGRGRPRLFAGDVEVHLTDDQMAYVKGTAAAEDRAVSQVARQLIGEAIAARQRKAGATR